MNEGICEHIDLVIKAIQVSGTYINSESHVEHITLDCDVCKVYAFLWQIEGICA